MAARSIWHLAALENMVATLSPAPEVRARGAAFELSLYCDPREHAIAVRNDSEAADHLLERADRIRPEPGAYFSSPGTLYIQHADPGQLWSRLERLLAAIDAALGGPGPERPAEGVPAGGETPERAQRRQRGTFLRRGRTRVALKHGSLRVYRDGPSLTAPALAILDYPGAAWPPSGGDWDWTPADADRQRSWLLLVARRTSAAPSGRVVPALAEVVAVLDGSTSAHV